MSVKIDNNIYDVLTIYDVLNEFDSTQLRREGILPGNYKIGLVLILLFRIYTVCSDWSKIHAEMIKLRTIMLKNNYPSSFTDRCIKLFFNRLFLAKKIAVPTVPRKVISFSIPFMGIDSQKIRGKLIGLAKHIFLLYNTCHV